MGFLTAYRAELNARKAYAAHVQGNRDSEEGKTAQAKQKHEQALELYAKAIEGGADKVAYLMAYGVLLMRFRRFEESREMFLKAERNRAITKGERSQLRINYAICQWKLGNLDSAIENLKIAKEQAATGVIYGSLGYILIEKARQTGDFAEAIAFNEEALEYDEDDGVILDNMGQLNMALGNKEKALEFFTRAHEIKPKQVDTLYYMATLALERGDKEAARKYLTDALDGNYSSLCTTTRDQAQALLNTIK